jgi:hypothetical protein
MNIASILFVFHQQNPVFSAISACNHLGIWVIPEVQLNFYITISIEFLWFICPTAYGSTAGADAQDQTQYTSALTEENANEDPGAPFPQLSGRMNHQAASRTAQWISGHRNYAVK